MAYSQDVPGSSVSSESHPLWAHHLGLRWVGSDAFASLADQGHVEALLERLSRTPPRDWLPPELMLRLRQCEGYASAGTAGHDLYNHQCGDAGGLLHNLVYGITFIPGDRVSAARLPVSGARMVVDCHGRHLQIRADLSWEEQLTLIRNTFAQAANAVFGSALEDALEDGSTADDEESCSAAPSPWVVSSASGGPLSRTTTETIVYRLGDADTISERSFRRRRRVSVWDFHQADDGRYIANRVRGDMPREYVSEDCFVDHFGAGEAPGPRRTVERIASLRARINVLDHCHGIDADHPCTEAERAELEAAQNAIGGIVLARYPTSEAMRQAYRLAGQRLYECGENDGVPGFGPECASLAEESLYLQYALNIAARPEVTRINSRLESLGCGVDRVRYFPPEVADCSTLRQQRADLLRGGVPIP